MGKFYRLGFTVLFLLVTFAVLAQNSPFTWGVKAGMTLNNSSIDANLIDQKTKAGFLLGVTVDYDLTNNFYLQSELSFLTKGIKVESEFSTDGIDIRGKLNVNQMYLRLPVTVAYKLPVTNQLKVVFNAGPYIAYGLGGKSKYEGDVDISQLEIVDNVAGELDTFSGQTLKRFDFGLTAGIGVEFKKISFGVNYDFGLINIMNSSELIETFFGYNICYKNQGLAINLGYKF